MSRVEREVEYCSQLKRTRTYFSDFQYLLRLPDVRPEAVTDDISSVILVSNELNRSRLARSMLTAIFLCSAARRALVRPLFQHDSHIWSRNRDIAEHSYWVKFVDDVNQIFQKTCRGR